MSDRELVTVYWGYWTRLKLRKEGTVVPSDVSIRWVDARRDSLELQQEILAWTAAQVGLKKMPPADIFGLHGVMPKEFAGETRIEVGKSLPSGRARVILLAKVATREELDACFAYEERMSEHFHDSEIGYVDGNDVGGGEYQMYVYGPRKGPLRNAVEAFVKEHGGDWKIR